MTAKRETPSAGKRGVRKNPSQQTTPRTLAITKKQAQAVELRIQALSYEQIAQRLGYQTKSAAYKAVEAGRKSILSEPAEELQQLEMARLDQMQADAWQALEQSKAAVDWEGALKAIDRLVKVSESRRKLLGLDAPARQDITSDGGSISVVFNEALAPKPPE